MCGRRAGKCFMMALCAVYLAAFRDYRRHLAPGERGTVMLIATDRRQARVVLRYIRALLKVPMLARAVERETAQSFDLDSGATIEVHVASFRSTRGYTHRRGSAGRAGLLAHRRLRPSQTTRLSTPSARAWRRYRTRCCCAPSSPYARRGALWDAHRRHFAKDGDPILVWQAETRTMNPTVPQSVIDEAMERDPAHAAAEYLAQFRTDIESFVTREAVEACVSTGVCERPRVPGTFDYKAFVDPSGGAADASPWPSPTATRTTWRSSTACARSSRRSVPRPSLPSSPRVLKTYGISKITGDRYAGEWPREQFRKHGVTYEPSDKPKTDLYRDCCRSSTRAGSTCSTIPS